VISGEGIGFQIFHYGNNCKSTGDKGSTEVKAQPEASRFPKPVYVLRVVSGKERR